MSRWDDVQTERQVRLTHQACRSYLRCERARSGDAFGRRRFGVLNGQLHTAQPCSDEGREPFLMESYAAGDELGVYARAVGRRDDLGEIAAQQRLATRQMTLDNAQVSSLPEDVRPLLRGQFI